MHKQYEEEPSRIEHEDHATITFTIALHGAHAWEILLEDSRRYHSLSHGGPLTIRMIGKMPSRPYCVGSSSRTNARASGTNTSPQRRRDPATTSPKGFGGVGGPVDDG